MPKKPKQNKPRPETYDKKLKLHPLTMEEALKIALETKPPREPKKPK